MQDECKNIILIDFKKKEKWEFREELEKQTNIKWEEIEAVSNKIRKNKFYNVIRYFKYFLFPLTVFFNRKKYSNIIAWQQFYGLLYAFYCRTFHVKKCNKLIIMTFIYKPKRGFIGKIYYKFMKYAVQSKYIDKIICFSKKECEEYAEIFNLEKEKFQFCTLGIEKIKVNKEKGKEKIIMSAGRSNRDYNFLYNALKDKNYKLNIVSDECKLENYKNIVVHNNIAGQKFFEMLNSSYIVIVPLMQENISSGQLVILQSMQLGKPVICTNSNAITDYIENGVTGLIIKKDEESLLKAIEELYNNNELYEKISANEKKIFEEKFSIRALGKQIAKMI